MTPYRLTREHLLRDLYTAYYRARRGKSRMSYVNGWESNLRENMDRLCDALWTRTYEPLRSKCFIVDYPKKREIFAAMFPDRIVHHLYYNYTHLLFEHTFIEDSYSCVPGRGTHFGIQRLNGFLRKESRNWQRKCYAMHLDIRGYFMHIDRAKLLEIALTSIDKMQNHRVGEDAVKAGQAVSSCQKWAETIDVDFICWLTRLIVMLDPRSHCEIVGSESNWDGLDPAKSMLHLADGLGLPIGNLTSQLFSNVYMNPFDQLCKRELKCRYYGRYVDDAIIVSSDREWLLSLVPRIREFLQDELHLTLHMGKLNVSEVHQGVEFLGSFIKPWRIYPSNHTLRRIRKNLDDIMQTGTVSQRVRSINSYLGIFRHTSAFNLSRQLLMRRDVLRVGVFRPDMTKFTERHEWLRGFLASAE